MSSTLSDFRKIALATRLEVELAYRRVGVLAAVAVSVALPPHLLRLWWRDEVRGSDRFMTCPTCDADVRIIVDEQCAGCGSERVVDAIERLRPGGEG